MKKFKSKLIVILGPTASGKSDLAVSIAKKIGGEVISADSRQVYTGLDIGTGKITAREMKSVPHHLLDVASPKKTFTVADFHRIADEKIADIITRGKVPILCGGTGFYIDAVVKNLILPEVKPDLELRIRNYELGIEELYEKLKKLDPKRAKEIDPKNKVRIIRAIEIASALGKVPQLKTKPKYDSLLLGLDFDKETLRERINLRLAKRIKAGMIKEAQILHSKGLSWRRMESLGLEYRYLALYLQKKITKEEMITELQNKIWQYAKRQKAWFRRNKKVLWIENKKEALASAKKFLSLM